jgi:hypothetical protein
VGIWIVPSRKNTLNTCENIPHLLVSKGDNKGGEKVTKGKIIEVQRQGGNTSLK